MVISSRPPSYTQSSFCAFPYSSFNLKAWYAVSFLTNCNIQPSLILPYSINFLSGSSSLTSPYFKMTSSSISGGRFREFLSFSACNFSSLIIYLSFNLSFSMPRVLALNLMISIYLGLVQSTAGSTPSGYNSLNFSHITVLSCIIVVSWAIRS